MIDWQEWLGALGMPIFLLLGGLLILWDRRRARRAAAVAEDGPEDEPYRVFTRAYDVELSHADIPAALHRASADTFKFRYDKAGKWATNRNYFGRFEAEQTPVAEIEDMLRGSIEIPAELVVCLLIDQSGSMLGAPIAAAASAVNVVVEALSRLGVRTEILGFSTAGWQGGFARDHWQRRLRPRRPGRLCALAHIVYKRIDEPLWTEASRDAFLHPDILRENIDGEALEWAEARLRATPAVRRILVMLSDGAPVDDSTIMANGPSYLVRHLVATIARIDAEAIIALGAVGIGYGVHEYYRCSRQAEAGSIAISLTQLIGELA
jgi:cobaltochelatase CobT